MKRTVPIVLVLLGIIAFFLWLPEPDAPQPSAWAMQQGNTFLLREVRVFDGESELGTRDVLVEEGHIAAIGAKLPRPSGVVEFAARGHTLLPGLLDAHTHNFMEARAEALRFGITTQVDMFAVTEQLSPARRQRESMHAATEADMWSAGTLVTAAGGHGTQFGLSIPTLDDAAEAEAFIAERVAEGSDFIKLVLEGGQAWDTQMPTLDEARLHAAFAAAHAHGKLAVVHVGTRDEARLAVDAGADGLVHLFADEVIDDALITSMVAQGTFIIPTLAVLESVAGRRSRLEEDGRLRPWIAPGQEDSLRRTFPSTTDRSAITTRMLESTRRLHSAGVIVLAGSDAPNPGTAHGVSLHRELELLVAAGLTPADALRAASAATADVFGIPERGRIARGHRADLVLVRGNPLEDITASRDIVSIWKNGYRVERARFDGVAPQPVALADPVLGTFTTGRDGWMETTDATQGGASTVALTVADGALRVAGELRPGATWPWAGAIRMFGTQPMEPVDLGAYRTLVIRIRGSNGPGLAQALLFSGRDHRPMPMTAPIAYGEEWRDVEIVFTEVTGFDPSTARAVGVTGGPMGRAFEFEIDSVVLR